MTEPHRRMSHMCARGYGWAHQRLRKTRGPARQYTCPCGERAEEWAYGHSDPNPRTDTIRTAHGKTTVVTWSDDPEHYIAMCRRCHARVDLEHGNRANIAAGLREYWERERSYKREREERLAAAQRLTEETS